MLAVAHLDGYGVRNTHDPSRHLDNYLYTTVVALSSHLPPAVNRHIASSMKLSTSSDTDAQCMAPLLQVSRFFKPTPACRQKFFTVFPRKYCIDVMFNASV